MNSVGKERYFAEVDDNSAGDTIVELCWKICWTPLGDRKTSPGTIFPWQLAEDNPVISWWGNNLWIKPGEHSHSAGNKLPESTGDKLPESAGEIGSTFLGILFRLDWGSGSTGCLVFRRGNNLILRLPGMLAEECLYSAGECWDLRGWSNFLKVDSRLTLLRESVADLLEILCLIRVDGRPTLLRGEYCWFLSYSTGSEGILVAFFSRTYLGTLVDRATRSLRKFWLPLFLMSPVISPLLRMQIFMS